MRSGPKDRPLSPAAQAYSRAFDEWLERPDVPYYDIAKRQALRACGIDPRARRFPHYGATARPRA